MKFEYKDISEKRIKELEKAGLNSIFVPEFGAYNPHLACWSYNCCSEDEEYIIDGSFELTVCGTVTKKIGFELKGCWKEKMYVF